MISSKSLPVSQSLSSYICSWTQTSAFLIRSRVRTVLLFPEPSYKFQGLTFLPWFLSSYQWKVVRWISAETPERKLSSTSSYCIWQISMQKQYICILAEDSETVYVQRWLFIFLKNQAPQTFKRAHKSKKQQAYSWNPTNL